MYKGYTERMVNRLTLRTKEGIGKDGQRHTFYYADLGSEDHGRPSARLWVSGGLVKRDERGTPYVEFPLKDAAVERTEKGTYVLRPRKGYITHAIYVPCGYRGRGRFTISPEPTGGVRYNTYRSPRGSLGIGSGGIFSFPVNAHPVRVEWWRTGRLYGATPRGVFYITAEGEVYEEVEI